MTALARVRVAALVLARGNEGHAAVLAYRIARRYDARFTRVWHLVERAAARGSK